VHGDPHYALGEGVDERRRSSGPIARVRNVLTDFRRTADSLGTERTLTVATSAIRDAENGEAFLGEVEWSYGFKTRLLSGHDEALMVFRGVTSERTLEHGTVIVDIGGGSTELVAGGPDGVRWYDSLDIGSVRITARILHSDPPPGNWRRGRRGEHLRSVPPIRATSALRPASPD
jgi:exopolyphosphatase/guanosine-5'-triphosphate,3'-diphosphate pyrophosphatase